eukprot:1392108-Amorphochlora_amoeboformis.AAC.2
MSCRRNGGIYVSLVMAMGMCYLGERGGKRMGRGKKKRMTELQDRDLFSSKELAGLFDDKGGLKEFSPPPLKDGASEVVM